MKKIRKTISILMVCALLYNALFIPADNNSTTRDVNTLPSQTSDAPISNFGETNSVFTPTTDRTLPQVTSAELKSDVAGGSWLEKSPTVFKKYANNPVLDLGPPGSWDCMHVSGATVIKDGSLYKMWYVGRDTAGTHRIGYAFSSDGINWTKYSGNPVLDVNVSNPWESICVFAPTVLEDGGVYEMWYSGSDGTNIRIGYARSSDGINWTKYTANPVLDIGSSSSWESRYVDAPTVIKVGGIYKMWYRGWNGTNSRIGYATSTNGFVWTKFTGNPVLDISSEGTWDDVHVAHPFVIYDGTTYKMWYAGYDGLKCRIGYAISSDGTNWLKSLSNPVLNTGSVNKWDWRHVSTQAIIQDGNFYRMWYTGSDGTNERTGYAETKFDDFNCITSEQITISTICFWELLAVNKTESADARINISVIDATTNLVIQNFENRTERSIDISNITAKSIRLRAYFECSKSTSLNLHWWGVEWNATNTWHDSFIGNSKVESYQNISVGAGAAKLARTGAQELSLEPNMVGLWHLNENTGSTTTDSSLNNNDGTLGNATIGDTAEPLWVSGKFGSALQFDGVDDYVNCGNDTSLDITTIDFTVAVWAKAIAHTPSSIISKGSWLNAWGPGYDISFPARPKMLFFNIYDGSTYRPLRTGLSAPFDWTHIVGVRRGDTIEVYVNGEIVCSQTYPITSISNTEPLLIGQNPSGGVFNGTIDEVVIYNRALSAEEIKKHYLGSYHLAGSITSEVISPQNIGRWHTFKANATFGNISRDYPPRFNTSAWWDFDEGDGAAVYDSSSNENTCTHYGNTRLLLHFDENSGLVAYDETAYSNNGTWNSSEGPTSANWTTGVSGTALQFDGVDDYVLIPHSESLNITDNPFTVEMWVYSNEDGRDQDLICKAFWNSLFSNGGYFIRKDYTNTYTFCTLNNNVPETASFGSFPTYEWHMLTAVYNGTFIITYVDGTKIDEQPCTRGIGSTAQNFLIGTSSVSWFYFNGTIDEVALYSKALSETEIQKHYKAGKAKFIDWVPGMFGVALKFDGVDDYAEVQYSESLNISGSITIECWLKISGGTGEREIITSHSTGYSGYELDIDDSDGSNKVCFYPADGTSWNLLKSNTALAEDVWYHVVAVNDCFGNRKIYINGTEDASAAGIDLRGSSSKLWIGSEGGISKFFNGTIDSLRILDRALTDDEIYKDYQARTNTTYKILNAADNSVICTINADDATAGYDISFINVSSIKLHATLISSDTYYTPILHEWAVNWTSYKLLHHIDIQPKSLTITVNESAQFTATGYDANNNIIPIINFNWSVEPFWLGTIDEKGLFKASTITGTGFVNATNGTVIGTAFITVAAGVVRTIEVTPNNITLTVGDAYQFSAEGYDEFNNSIPNLIFTWTSTIGVIDANGLFDAGTVPGTGFVNATNGTVVGSAFVTVTVGEVISIIIEPQNPVITADDTIDFDATCFDKYNNEVPVAPQWSVTNGTITQDGLFTPYSTGTWTVYANYSTVAGTTTVTVTHGAVQTILVTPQNPEITADETIDFNATGFDKYNNEVPVAPQWSVTNGTITQDGLFTPYSTGKWTVYANYSGISGNTTVTVTVGSVQYIVVSPSSVTLFTSETMQFSAAGFDRYDNLIKGLVFNWTTDVGSINETGFFIAGNVSKKGYVNASVGDIVGSAQVTVKAREEAMYGVISGAVFANKKPVPDALVEVVFHKNRTVANFTYTKQDGRFRITLHPEIYDITITKKGFEPYIRTEIIVEAGVEKDIGIIELRPVPPFEKPEEFNWLFVYIAVAIIVITGCILAAVFIAMRKKKAKPVPPPTVMKKAPQTVIAQVVAKCGICDKKIEVGDSMVICGCKKKYHKDCADTKRNCPRCGNVIKIVTTVIDEVFLMYHDGRLIKHETRRLKPDIDKDILSSMLLAVQEFIKDSFRGEEGWLDELKFGELKILVGRGKWVLIAAVIVGEEAEPFRPQIMNAIRDIEYKYKDVLEEWDGYMEKVAPIGRELRALIQGKYKM